MAKKSIFDMLNQTSKQAIEVKQDSTASNIKMLDIKDLVPSKENFYSTEEIETLKETIEMFGVMQNILVTKIPESSQYRILAGHRRCMAINRLVEEGKTKFSQVPCLIRESEEETRSRLQLLFANSTMRQLSDWERVEQTRQLKEVLKEYKELGNELPGRLRDYIAGALDVSPTTAGRLEKIDKNLVQDLKESLKKGDIALTTATELAGMSAADQKAVYEQTGGKLKLSDVNKKNNIPELQEKVEPVGEIERETMVLPKSHKTKAEIRIGYYTDEKYRYGISCQTSTAGYGFMPSEYSKTYSTFEEARVAALQEMADWNETLKKSLISGGYIAKPTKEKKQEYQESGSQLPADTEHRIYAVKSTMELLQKQIEKAAALKQIDESEGNTQRAANRAAQIEYLGEILGRAQNDLFDLSGQNIFEGCMNK